jgi:ABC-type polysaccharide/polyol phosphate transport system ATPase subunit
MASHEPKDDVESAIRQTETHSTHEDLKSGNVDFERGQLLAELGDPDAGKSDEERKAIDKKLMWKVDLWLVPWLSIL